MVYRVGPTYLGARWVRGAALCSMIALLSLPLGACDRNRSASTTEAPVERPVTRTAESDTVTLAFTVAPGDLPFSEKATVVIEVEGDAGTTVTMEGYATTIRRSEHQFELAAKEVSRKEAVVQPNGRVSWTYRYELEFVLPGEYELPGPSLTYMLPAADAVGDDESDTPLPTRDTQRLSTESIAVIAEATADATMTPEELAQIEVLRPVEMREPPRIWAWIAPIVAAGAIVLFLILRRRGRVHQAAPVIVVPAHEWALAAIAGLVAEDLPRRGLIQDFHYRISDILRGYIERRYAVLAREMTTEEFLATASSDPRFDAGASSELDRFLHACDLVKYAKHTATAADAEALLHTTRSFVERTRERYVRIAGEADGDVTGGRAA